MAVRQLYQALVLQASGVYLWVLHYLDYSQAESLFTRKDKAK